MNNPEKGVAGLPPVDGEPAGWIAWAAALAAVSAGLYVLLLGVGADLSSPATWRIATFVVAEAFVVIVATFKARLVWVFVGVPIVVFGCFRVLADMAVESGDSQSGLETVGAMMAGLGAAAGAFAIAAATRLYQKAQEE